MHFIQDEDQIPAWASLLQNMELAGADERAAAAATTDELDDPRTAFAFEFWKLEGLPPARERSAFKCVRLLAFGHQAVEVEIRVELALLRLEKVQRVQFEDLHDELRRVFNHDIKLDVVTGRKLRRVRGGKFNINAFLELLEFGGSDQ